MKSESTKSFTVYYKNSTKFDTERTSDKTLYTFTCSAVDHADAVRQLRLSRMYAVTVRDMRSKKTVKFHKSFRVKGFKVVRVFDGDGIGYCTCSYCKEHPDMSRKVTVIKSREPRWMQRNFFGKGR